MNDLLRLFAALLLVLPASAQTPSSPRRGPNPNQGIMALLAKVPLVAEFDADGDGRLDATERAKARAAIRQRRAARRFRQTTPALVYREDYETLVPSSVTKHSKRKLYDSTILRTFFLYMKQDDWYGELADFWRTDVELPGTLLVDGATLEGVGVRFRGTSSYLLARRSPKKSLNLSIDFTHRGQRLRGQRTINLLNAVGDTTLMREVLYSSVCREFVPTMRVNFVRLVINGDDWGVYANAQQFNSDFLADAFGSRKGVRWKVLRNYRGAGALTYLGDDPSKYSAYELKTTSDKKAMSRLIRLCRVLNETPTDKLPSVLPPLLDVDGALWFLALENVFMDTDGYLRQGYDYRLVEDRHGRFHPIPYDGNEAMIPGNASPRAVQAAQRIGQIVLGTDTSPFAQANNLERPLVSRLLSVPEWRARYLAHVRTLARDWLDWRRIGEIARRLHELIDPVVEHDVRRGTSYEAFAKSLEQDVRVGFRNVRSLRGILEERRKYLLAHKALSGTWPAIESVTASVVTGVAKAPTATPRAAQSKTKPVVEREESDRARSRRIRVEVRVDAKVRVDSVHLYTATKRGPYGVKAMRRSDGGAWVAETDALREGGKLRYYVEARSAAGRSVFHPSKAESGPMRIRVGEDK